MLASLVTNVNTVLLSPKNSRTVKEYCIHLLIAALLLSVLIWFYTNQSTIHHDLAGNILAGKLAVELGDAYALYSIYFPPAEKLWFSMVEWLHMLTGWRSDHIIISMTTLVVFFSAELAYIIRKKTVGSTLWFLIGSTIALVMLPILFKNVFGLREHLVALGLWPYLIYRISDPTGTKLNLSLRILIGLWLGWALLFKYLYAIVVFLVELTDAIIQRRVSILFRIENLISGTIISGYLFIWLILQPENHTAISVMKNAIGGNIIPLETNAYHIALYSVFTLPLLAAGFLYKVNNRQLAINIALTMATILVAAIQARWYAHHYFLIIMANIILLWIINVNTPKIIAGFICIFFTISIYTEFKNSDFNQGKLSQLTKSFEQNNIDLNEKRIALLTAYPSPFNEMIVKQGGIRWTTLVNMAYVTTELKKYDVPENTNTLAPRITEFTEGRAMFQDKTLSLWESQLPDVIIMDHSTSWPLEYIHINWQHLFSKDKRFNAILNNYELSHSQNSEGLNYEYYTLKN